MKWVLHWIQTKIIFLDGLSQIGTTEKWFLVTNYKYNLINSSLTADGVKIPRSVNNRVINDGGV